jgi:hypothetical protein
MASTRNRNTPGNYRLEKTQSIRPCDYSTYIQSSYGITNQTYFPGNGLIGARIPRSELSTNSCDIETQLLGIGSCNLETPQPEIVPEIQQRQSLNICDRIPLIVPPPLVVDTANQRPLFLN